MVTPSTSSGATSGACDHHRRDLHRMASTVGICSFIPSSFLSIITHHPHPHRLLSAPQPLRTLMKIVPWRGVAGWLVGFSPLRQWRLLASCRTAVHSSSQSGVGPVTHRLLCSPWIACLLDFIKTYLPCPRGMEHGREGDGGTGRRLLINFRPPPESGWIPDFQGLGRVGKWIFQARQVAG